MKLSSSSSSSPSSSGMPLNLGYSETGRNRGSSTCSGSPESLSDSSDCCDDSENALKYDGRSICPKLLVTIAGGRRLALRPSCALSSSCFAISRLCAANASSGDNAGGTSPSKCWNLGEGNGSRSLESFFLDCRSSVNADFVVMVGVMRNGRCEPLQLSSAACPAHAFFACKLLESPIRTVDHIGDCAQQAESGAPQRRRIQTAVDDRGSAGRRYVRLGVVREW